MCTYVHVHVCVRVHVCSHMCACVCVISGLSNLFRISAKPINLHTLYSHEIAFIFFMWGYLSFYIFAGDVAQWEAFDAHS